MQKQCVGIDNNENNSSEDVIQGVPEGLLFGLPHLRYLLLILKMLPISKRI